MLRLNRLLLALLSLIAAAFIVSRAAAVENTWDYSVRVSATVQVSPAQITLSWPQDTNGTPASYTVYRKAPDATDWGAGTSLAGGATSYTDSSVSAGAAYEYRVVKNAGGYMGTGYIVAGINAPLVDQRGTLVLLVDSSIAGGVTNELTRLQLDLAGDGWAVLRHDVGRGDSPGSVKALIAADYRADPAHVKAVFLFGHIPVPYSGQQNPDGHPDHVGAWPADVYYGDIDGNWTDNSVNYTQSENSDAADAARLTNRPGDGKFDQTEIPSNVELAVGRVDLANMPGIETWGAPPSLPGETELLRKYLNKDHDYRHRITNPARRALIGDYFGARNGEAFSASGYRSFAPLVGPENVRNLNVEFNDQKGVWIAQAAQADYLLTYGAGAGSYLSIGGLGTLGANFDGNTYQMVTQNVRGVFNLLFGSWFGDWDHEDSVLRAPLATGAGLVSVWSGRPHWFIHPLGLGATIGDTTRLTQNNTSTYETQINDSAHRIHIALMGDPTLRLYPVAPAANLNGNANGGSVALSWSASNDSNIVGYHVYRGTSAGGGFTRVTSAPVTSTSYTDQNAPAGSGYMVRAVKLETTASGSFYNASQGVFWNVSGAAASSGSAPQPATTDGSVASNDNSGSGKITGSAREVGINIVHPNGNVYDQVLLTGPSATVTADPGQVTRVSFVDLNDDIVQVEFSGAGTLALALEAASGPSAPAKYNQPGIVYMKGHARLTITGADESTNVSVFSVGGVTAVNSALFRSDVGYDGVADLASITIVSRNGKFGGVRAGNANFFATSGRTGLDATGVEFTGPVLVHEVNASDGATPSLVLGRSDSVSVAGGSLAQPNNRAVEVSGIPELKFTNGTTSFGKVLPAQSLRGTLYDVAGGLLPDTQIAP
jgi:hypothetical protein